MVLGMRDVGFDLARGPLRPIRVRLGTPFSDLLLAPVYTAQRREPM